MEVVVEVVEVEVMVEVVGEVVVIVKGVGLGEVVVEVAQFRGAFGKMVASQVWYKQGTE